MSITLIPDAAIYQRAWTVADATERATLLATYASPFGPKRGDFIQQLDTSDYYLVVDDGIAFKISYSNLAVQSASSWTPGIDGSGGSSGLTYAVQLGEYVKVGRHVIASFFLMLSGMTSITGVIRLTGLPFTVGGSLAGLLTPAEFGNTNTSYISMYVRPVAGQTYCAIKAIASALTSGPADIAQADITTSFLLVGSAVYNTDS